MADKLKKILRFDIRYVMKNGSWLMLSNLFAVLSVLVTSYVFANYLDPTTYGEYKYLLSAGAVLTSFSLTGLGLAVIQGAAKNITGFLNYASKIGFRYGLIVTVLALSISAYYFYQDNTGLALGFLCIATFQPFFNNSSLIFNYLYGKEAYSTSTYASITKTTLTSLVLIGSALYFKDPIILLISYLLTNTVVNYAVRYATKPSDRQEKTTEGIKLISYAKHTSVRNIFTNLAGNIDKILVFQNLSAADLAIYAFAIAIPEQFKSITKSINALLLPRFSRHNSENIKANMVYKAMVYGFFLLVLTASYIVAAPYIYKLLFPTYQESIFLSQVFSLITLTALAGLPTAALQASRNSAQLYKLDILTAVFQTISMITLFHFFGLIGVVYGRILGRVFATSLAFWLFFSTTPDKNTV